MAFNTIYRRPSEQQMMRMICAPVNCIKLHRIKHLMECIITLGPITMIINSDCRWLRDACVNGVFFVVFHSSFGVLHPWTFECVKYVTSSDKLSRRLSFPCDCVCMPLKCTRAYIASKTRTMRHAIFCTQAHTVWHTACLPVGRKRVSLSFITRDTAARAEHRSHLCEVFS